jgi:hypothetical protein
MNGRRKRDPKSRPRRTTAPSPCQQRCRAKSRRAHDGFPRPALLCHIASMGSGDKRPGAERPNSTDPDRRRSAIGKVVPSEDLIVVRYFRYRYREAYISQGPLRLRASSGLMILPGRSCRSEPETTCRQSVGAYQSNPQPRRTQLAQPDHAFNFRNRSPFPERSFKSKQGKSGHGACGTGRRF